MARPSTEVRELAPEARLVLCCARGRLEPGQREALARIAAAQPDWGAVVAWARTHALVPLVFRHLDEALPREVPREVLLELWIEAEKIARRNRAMARELLAILGELDAAGVPAIAYKGPALAFALHGDVAMREYGDLDILVRPKDLQRARAVLEARGYVPEFPLEARMEEAFLRAPSQYHLAMDRSDGMVVELHWKSDADFPVERADDAWWSNLGTAPLGEAAVRAFAPREMLLVLCLHGSKHAWSCLGWLADVAEAIRAQPATDWDWIFDRAQRLACTRRLALGLRLARDVLGAPLPDTVAREIAKDRAVERLAARIAASWFDASPAPPSPWQGLAVNLALYDRVPQRMAHVFNTLFAPSLVEWTRWPLPRAFFFLYPPLRVTRLARKYWTRHAAHPRAT